jgi:hypothetical protein
MTNNEKQLLRNIIADLNDHACLWQEEVFTCSHAKALRELANLLQENILKEEKINA